MSAAVQLPTPMTVTEFMAWSARQPGRWQLMDGVPHAMAPNTRTHALLQAQMTVLIDEQLRGTPCVVLSGSGVVPRHLAAINARIPDIIVTCTPYTVEESLLENPILLVEILSPSNQDDTWRNVWAYTSIPNLREVLVLESHAIGGQVLRRRPDGAWPEIPERIGEDLALESIGLTVPLATVYHTTRLATG